MQCLFDLAIPYAEKTRKLIWAEISSTLIVRTYSSGSSLSHTYQWQHELVIPLRGRLGSPVSIPGSSHNKSVL